MEVTQKQLKKLVSYNPINGVFTWLERDKSTTEMYKRFNTMYAGKAVTGKFSNGYPKISLSVNGAKKYYSSHRMAWLYVHGEIPQMIDHINGNIEDCRIENLRPATTSQNQRNRKLNSNNKSGVCGVYKHSRTGKWVAKCPTIEDPNKRFLLESMFEAVCIRKSYQNSNGYSNTHGIRVT